MNTISDLLWSRTIPETEHIQIKKAQFIDKHTILLWPSHFRGTNSIFIVERAIRNH